MSLSKLVTPEHDDRAPMMRVPLLDLKAQSATIRDDVRAAIDRVCDSQAFILGPEVTQLEDTIASMAGSGHAVGVSSGTDALLVALMALNVGTGDEVITTPYSFFATAGVIARLGARPVFVDIDPRTYNIDADAVADRVTDKTKAMMPVHLFGCCAAMNPLREIASRAGIHLIEDAAQALGAHDDLGRPAGSIGDIGCFLDSSPARTWAPLAMRAWLSRATTRSLMLFKFFESTAPNRSTTTASSAATSGSTRCKRPY